MPQIGIPGTSYSLQLSSNNRKVVLHILKGTDVIDSYILKDEDVEDVDDLIKQNRYNTQLLAEESKKI